MDRHAFLMSLEKELKKRKIDDVSDIIDEYNDYIIHQLELGKKEKNIIAFIGDVKSIANAYVDDEVVSKTKWFDVVATSIFAIPILILMYGFFIALICLVIASWSIAIYYLFGLNSLQFMPSVPLVPSIGFILTLLSFAFLVYLLSYRYFLLVKSMTNQFIVKQKIVVGKYELNKSHIRLTKIAMITFFGFMFISYLIAMIYAKSFEFWHVWQWFI
ncbi:MAG: DUF1700 domain-containing protein [Acholeplasmataceae bacterium]